MGTLFRQTPNNGYPFLPKWPLKMGTGLAASAAHPRPNNIWVPPPPPGGRTPPLWPPRFFFSRFLVRDQEVDHVRGYPNPTCLKNWQSFFLWGRKKSVEVPPPPPPRPCSALSDFFQGWRGIAACMDQIVKHIPWRRQNPAYAHATVHLYNAFNDTV